jgi:hypothetical protein
MPGMAIPPDERDPASTDEAPAIDLDERKERVLHTRVPESLDRHIKHRARSLGMSVSTVVRNVLITTFGLVEDIVTDSANIALAATGGETVARTPGRARRGSAPGAVLAWQEAILNVNTVCDDCNTILPRGDRAAIGIGEEPGPRAIICAACLGKLGRHGNAGGQKRAAR